MKNFQTTLEDCGATWNNVVKMNIHLIEGHDSHKAFEVSKKFMKTASNPPVITLLYVSDLVRPEFMIEVDGIVYLD